VYIPIVADSCFEDVAQFRYLGTNVTNQNLIQEAIQKTFNSGNACYHSVHKLLSSCLLSKNIKIRIYKGIILPVVLYGCETWPFDIKEGTYTEGYLISGVGLWVLRPLTGLLYQPRMVGDGNCG
jgi:hypothetical protein